MPRNILFFANGKTSVNGMKYILQESLKYGYKCKILACRSLSNKLNDVNRENIIFIPNNYLIVLQFIQLFKSWMIINLFIKLIESIFNLDRNILLKYFWTIRFNARYSLVKKLIKKNMPDIIYTTGDRGRDLELPLLKFAKDHNIITAIVPIAYFLNKEQLHWKFKTKKLRRQNKFKNKNVTNSLDFMSRYEQQCIKHEITDSYLSFYEPWLTEAMDEVGVLPSNPWTIGGGISKYLCVENHLDFQRFIDQGVPKDKIKITGNPEHDVLHKIFKNNSKLKRLFLESINQSNKSDKILIVILPHLKEHKILNEEEHWRTVENILNPLMNTNWNILISLHPKCEKSEYLYLEEKFNCKILTKPLRNFLPLADLCIVGAGSSTGMWAMLSEVPLVIINWYGIVNILGHIKSIIIINKKDRYSNEIKNLLLNDFALKEYKENILNETKILNTIFDGNSCKRLLDLSNKENNT